MNCLAEFTGRSGLDINLGKSKLFVSSNIQAQVTRSFSASCGIPLTSDLGIYLGVPIIHSRHSSASYKHVLEKMQLKLTGWKQKFLSLAGRRTLVQSVTSSIPAYTMQTRLLPKATCEAIDRLNRRFLWGSDISPNKPHLVSRNDVSLPRAFGGLGLRLAYEHNKALIAKLGWQLFSGHNKPWCQVFQQKYLSNKSLFNYPVKPSSSVTWQTILRCNDVLHLGIRWRVGSGNSINLWQDIWVGDSKLQDVVENPIPPNLLDFKVSNIISPNQSWDITCLQHLLPNHLLNLIIAIPLPIAGSVNDGVYWQGSLNGEFSVKFAFLLIQQSRLNDLLNGIHWTWIWKLDCAERIKMFVWLLFRGVVQTNSVRFTRHLASTPVCPRCEQASETPLHLLMDCYYAKQVWEYSGNVPSNFSH
ncbi:hypothetical protein SLE2022_132990 [Rubroshorea leprosula]